MKKTIIKTMILIIIFFILFSCAGRKPQVEVPGGKFDETGEASWYGNEFEGRKTASGEIFDGDKLTAAHKTLPLGTIVGVTNLNNNKTVRVKINDRGPFVKGRIVDLSSSAAKKIDLIGPGVAPVGITILSGASNKDLGPDAWGDFCIQVGAFENKRNAEKLIPRMIRFGPVYLVEFEGFYRVRVGHFTTKRLADDVYENMKKQNIGGFVTRND